MGKKQEFPFGVLKYIPDVTETDYYSWTGKGRFLNGKIGEKSGKQRLFSKVELLTLFLIGQLRQIGLEPKQAYEILSEYDLLTESLLSYGYGSASVMVDLISARVKFESILSDGLINLFDGRIKELEKKTEHEREHFESLNKS